MTEPRTWRIKLPWNTVPLSMNGRQHYQAKARITREIRTTTGLLLRSRKVPAMAKVNVWLEWTVGDKQRRDTDNPAPTLKAAADALVDAGVLPDDTPEFVSKKETVIIYERGVRALHFIIEEAL